VFVLAPIRAIHGASESPLFGELLKKAQQEGAVVWWDSADDEQMQKILKEFEKKFNIRAKYERWQGVAKQQRTLIFVLTLFTILGRWIVVKMSPQ